MDFSGITVFSIILAAGWPIWPLLFASIIAVALIIERMVALRRSKVLPTGLLQRVIAEYRQGAVNEAMLNNLEAQSPLGRVLAAGLRNVGSTREIMRESIEEVGGAVAHELERYLTTLGTIASISPLMGLLGTVVSLADRYAEGWSYKVVIGESAVTDLESEIANEASGGDGAARERSDWQRQREDYRRASERGLSYADYQDQMAQDDYLRRMEEQAPSEDEFEEVAVAVYFPKLEPDYPGQKDALLIKARVSTLAISGYTPQQAASVARAKGLSATGEGAGGPVTGGAGAER